MKKVKMKVELMKAYDPCWLVPSTFFWRMWLALDFIKPGSWFLHCLRPNSQLCICSHRRVGPSFKLSSSPLSETTHTRSCFHLVKGSQTPMTTLQNFVFSITKICIEVQFAWQSGESNLRTILTSVTGHYLFVLAFLTKILSPYQFSISLVCGAEHSAMLKGG